MQALSIVDYTSARTCYCGLHLCCHDTGTGYQLLNCIHPACRVYHTSITLTTGAAMLQASNLASTTSSTPQKNPPCCAQLTPHRPCGANAATWQVSRPSRHPLPAWHRSCRRCPRRFRESIRAPTCRTAPCNACSCLCVLFSLRRLLRTPGLPGPRAAAAPRRKVRSVASVIDV